MRVLFWLSISLDRHSTSGHLLAAVMEKVRNVGAEVHVLQKSTHGDLPLLPEALTNIGVTTEAIPFDPPEKSNFAKRYIYELKYIRKSGKRISSNYDAIFIQSSIAAGFSVRQAKRRCPSARIVYNVQDVYPQDVLFAGRIGKHDPAYIAMYLVQKYAYKKANSIITISEDMKEELLNTGLSEDKITVIYNWSYQDNLIAKESISPQIAALFNPNMFNVVYAGNIGLFQNVDIVIDAANRLKNDKDIWFHIFGNGLYKETLEGRAKRLNIENITFHPIQPHELATSVYASASVNLIPLGPNQFRAALPSKTATCLACQQPVVFIIGRDSQFGRKVSAETGCPLLDCDDVEGLSKAIIDIKESKFRIQTGEFFLKYCSITKNSTEYAKIITEH